MFLKTDVPYKQHTLAKGYPSEHANLVKEHN
jgi:hypothetical protein